MKNKGMWIAIVVAIIVIIGVVLLTTSSTEQRVRDQIAAETAEKAKDDEIIDLQDRLDKLESGNVSSNNETYASGVYEENSNKVHLFILNPEAGDKEQIPHPQVYIQTNVSGNSETFVLDVPNGYVGIIGGFRINKETDGVYRALKPGSHEYDITDGFALIIRDEWAQDEWDFRIGQAKEYKWAHKHIYPGPLKK